MPPVRLHVLDGTATLFRAYFGMNKVKAPDGREVGGLLGFCQALSRFIRTVRPTHVALVFDTAERTLRHDVYADYKANREAPPDDMEHQFDLSLRCTEALGLRHFRIPGYEADDLMATMAARGRTADVEVDLVSPDKDILQLISDGVQVLDPKTYEAVTAEDLRERLGVLPERLIDYLALAGDSSDNVPGVRGIGPKSAAALVSVLGSLEDIYGNLERVADLPVRGAKSMAAKLEAGRDNAFLSRDLVRLYEDAPLSAEAMSLGDLRWRGPTSDADELFDELGFHAPLRALRAFVEGG